MVKLLYSYLVLRIRVRSALIFRCAIPITLHHYYSPVVSLENFNNIYSTSVKNKLLKPTVTILLKYFCDLAFCYIYYYIVFCAYASSAMTFTSADILQTLIKNN